MKIYTKTGDAGTTGLFGGARVSKASDRVSAYGEIDELNSVIGLARAHGIESRKNNWLARIQSELFDLGAELSTVQEKQESVAQFWLGDEDIQKLEHAIDELETELTPLKAFVLPAAPPRRARCISRAPSAGARSVRSWRSPRGSRCVQRCFGMSIA